MNNLINKEFNPTQFVRLSYYAKSNSIRWKDL
ncbi:hypothetical protein Murru_2706 [Allomuricauda ruestringensis DSM 13258]|uniref:Uncharacterized protein n=1 Tax=Allomuricauda ruestringensis (strain DSM 13258 / CIP 107369 / LMG 19739 / B1) TaxID=886377 RepID=G2PIB9_ALLRU|nr:hypothetical protein Murru_2706 [Allomuricauda ruestringensis DSM 13258]